MWVYRVTGDLTHFTVSYNFQVFYYKASITPKMEGVSKNKKINTNGVKLALKKLRA